ncbi:Lrp/AsnC family transcriptional regulator [Roseospira navarrensis]|uniref:Winged helix-turn-helix transcriptional regulator n=1 Tax=Roseospira navarrensis TaxID=140058 RepID=A0A7X2D4J0_9PROT|nr:Lrp/AsnC family transcriptional regulator [Roseospira navarrensis]MQX36250.1 winged helix-turn-helix transcriptional regulator [Roseospira navarrensis]
MSPPDESSDAGPSSVRLDAIDRRILRTLSTEGRISNADLAARVGLSPSPCWKRVKALEARGFIIGYGARLSREALGFPETVIINVTLESHNEDTLARFGQVLADIPEVMEAYLVTGDYDYLIRVAVAGTRHYESFLRETLYKIPGIRHSRSSFVLRELKTETSLLDARAGGVAR